MLYDLYMPKAKSCYDCMEETEEILAQQESWKDKLSKEIDDYLRVDPNYDQYKDKRLRSMVWGITAYNDLRDRYWENRVIEAGLCQNSTGYIDHSCVYGTASALQDSYDNSEVVWQSGWDSNKVVWPAVVLDAVGIPLGFVGMGGPLKFGEFGTWALKLTGYADSGASYVYARRTNDGVGKFLAFASASPLVGGLFSAMALGRDIGQGIYQYEWTPPIPR